MCNNNSYNDGDDPNNISISIPLWGFKQDCHWGSYQLILIQLWLCSHRRSSTWSSLISQSSYICSNCSAVLYTSTCRNICQTSDNNYGLILRNLSLYIGREPLWDIPFLYCVCHWVILCNRYVLVLYKPGWRAHNSYVLICMLDFLWSVEAVLATLHYQRPSSCYTLTFAILIRIRSFVFQVKVSWRSSFNLYTCFPWATAWVIYV